MTINIGCCLRRVFSRNFYIDYARNAYSSFEFLRSETNIESRKCGLLEHERFAFVECILQ